MFGVASSAEVGDHWMKRSDLAVWIEAGRTCAVRLLGHTLGENRRDFSERRRFVLYGATA